MPDISCVNFLLITLRTEKKRLKSSQLISQFVEVRDPIIFVVSCAGVYIIKRCTAVLANPGNVGEREEGGGGEGLTQQQFWGKILLLEFLTKLET